jgi:hypothetical protein
MRVLCCHNGALETGYFYKEQKFIISHSGDWELKMKALWVRAGLCFQVGTLNSWSCRKRWLCPHMQKSGEE